MQDLDLVLMDIKMPLMDGMEAIWEIKKIRPGMAVIAVTAYAWDADNSRASYPYTRIVRL